MEASSRNGIVHLYRLRAFKAGGVTSKLVVNNAQIAMIKQCWKKTISIPSGENIIASKGDAKGEIKLQIEQGKEYYIRCDFKVGIFSPSVKFTIINDVQLAQKEMSGLQADTQIVGIKNLYSIELPSFLTPAILTNKAASLHYSSTTDGMSVSIIDSIALEADGFDFEAFTTFSLIGFKPEKISISDKIDTVINGKKITTFTVLEKATIFTYFHKFGIIEGKDRLYRIQVTADKEFKHQMDEIIKSFKEL